MTSYAQYAGFSPPSIDLYTDLISYCLVRSIAARAVKVLSLASHLEDLTSSSRRSFLIVRSDHQFMALEEDAPELKYIVGGVGNEFERIVTSKEWARRIYRSDYMRSMVVDTKTINHENQLRKRQTRRPTDQDNKWDISIVSCIKTLGPYHERVLNSMVSTYRDHQNEIDQLKKFPQFDKPFSIRAVAPK